MTLLVASNVAPGAPRQETTISRALVIIDIQKDYFPGGRMELVGSEAAAGRAHELLSAFRESGEPVFHVQHVWDSDDAPFFAPDTEGVEIYPTLLPQGDERHIVKHHANAFLETPLEEELRRIGASDVVICGMMTSMCVDASARAAADLGFTRASPPTPARRRTCRPGAR